MAERKTSPQEETPETSGAWRELPWRKLEKHVYRIQKRIYQASQRGNHRQVEKLQKLLLKYVGGSRRVSWKGKTSPPPKREPLKVE